MKKQGLQQVVAGNLDYFMKRDDCLYPNANALSKATNGKVSPNTIRYLLDPKRRTVTTKKGEGYPTIEKLESLAQKLPKCETWMLLHPELDRALRAMDMERAWGERAEKDKKAKQSA